MTRGILIYAHNSRDVDYAKLAIISASLAKKNLNLPVSLVTDQSTMNWLSESNNIKLAESIFDKIILTDKPEAGNQRVLFDGKEQKTVPFNNGNRSSAYDLTPYDQTLLIDSDFLILSNRLNAYWDINDKVKIAISANDILNTNRLGYQDKYISDTGIHMFWATTVMFEKNYESKVFFDLVSYIKKNYRHFADLYMFDPRQFRNDIAFSIAKHLTDGFETNTTEALPSLLTAIDKDILYSVDNSKLTFLISSINGNDFVATSINGVDIHVMNKQSIIRNFEHFMENL